MSALFAALKTLVSLGGFVRWLVDTIQAAKKADAKRKADEDFAKNSDAIDRAFSDSVQPADSAKPEAGSSSAHDATPAIPASEAVRADVGQGGANDNQQSAAGDSAPKS